MTRRTRIRTVWCTHILQRPGAASEAGVEVVVHVGAADRLVHLAIASAVSVALESHVEPAGKQHFVQHLHGPFARDGEIPGKKGETREGNDEVQNCLRQPFAAWSQILTLRDQCFVSWHFIRNVFSQQKRPSKNSRPSPETRIARFGLTHSGHLFSAERRTASSVLNFDLRVDTHSDAVTTPANFCLGHASSMSTA